MADEKDPGQEESGKKDSLQEKIGEKLDDFKKNENVRQAVEFAQSNKGDTFGFIALVVGILILIFNQFWGGIIIGAIAGLYFADPLISWVRNFKDYVEKDGYVKAIILLGVALGLLIVAPAFFLGCVAAVGVKYIIASSN